MFKYTIFRYKNTKMKYHRFNGTNSLVSEVLIPFFCPSFSNSFHCISSIMLWYFNFFLPIVPNWNGPTIICSAKEMSSWYHTYFWLFCQMLCTLLDITGNIFSSVQSWLLVLISGQKRHFIVGYLLQSSYCLMYHRQWYTPLFLIETGSYWSISTCTKYHLAWVDPSDMCLMKTSYPLIFQCHYKYGWMIFGQPVLSFLSFYVELIPLPPVPDNPSSAGLCFLHHLTHH